jgi:hypothetical protein
MPSWLGYFLAIAALLILAPLMAWVGHRHGRKLKGGLALASMLFVVLPFEPPPKPKIEANVRRVAGDDESGDPPDPDVSRPKPSDG